MAGNGGVAADQGEEATVPLLEERASSELDDQALDRLGKRVCVESHKLWRITGPTLVFRIASYSAIIVSQAFGGHIGNTELAAISVAYSLILGFEFGLLLGMASALETLCGQAFGAKKYHMMGVYLQRSWIVLTMWCIVMLPLQIYASPILKFLGQPPAVAELTGVVSLWMIPLLFCFGIIFPLQRFLQSQSKGGVLAYVSVAALLVHVLLTWLSVNVLQLGLIGIAVTLNLTWWLMALGLFVYVVLGGVGETWSGFSMDAFSGLWEFAKISAGAGIMLCISVSSWHLNVAFSFFAGSGVRVANELGAGNGKAAKLATTLCSLTCLAIGIVCWLAVMLFNEQIARIFSSSEVVLQVVGKMREILAFSILLNSVHPVLSGAAVGLGWQTYGALINLTSYYIFGVPLGIFLAWYLDMGVVGIWTGMLIGGVGCQTLALTILVYRCKWEQEAERTHYLWMNSNDDMNKKAASKA